MPIEIKLPAMSPTMEEGTLAKWLVKEGDTVKPGDILAEIETDKATMELEADEGGTVARLLVADGTREASLAAALNLLMQARGLLPHALAVLAINKFDLLDRWEIAPPTLVQLRRSLTVFETSAATGAAVEDAFEAIAAGLGP